MDNKSAWRVVVSLVVLTAGAPGCVSSRERSEAEADVPRRVVARELSVTDTTEVVRIPPPAPLNQMRPEQPSLQHVWIPGKWAWHNGEYVWIKGLWMLAEEEGDTWVPGYWKAVKGGWVWVPGRWKGA